MPPRLPATPTLANVYLSHNALQALDGDSLLGASAVRELHAGDNQLTSLPDEVGALAQLKVLDVSNNNLSDLPASLGYVVRADAGGGGASRGRRYYHSSSTPAPHYDS